MGSFTMFDQLASKGQVQTAVQALGVKAKVAPARSWDMTKRELRHKAEVVLRRTNIRSATAFRWHGIAVLPEEDSRRRHHR